MHANNLDLLSVFIITLLDVLSAQNASWNFPKISPIMFLSVPIMPALCSQVANILSIVMENLKY